MTISKKKKEKQRILDALSDKAKLSENKGPLINSSFHLSRKSKKHSGRYTPQIDQKGKISEMIANAEEPTEEYNDWINYRDGWRHGSDRNHLFRRNRGCSWMSPEEIKESNKKIRKQMSRRKASKRKFS